ncbi:FAD-dependent 5-carboxymethylaminomethyl-2-thiouridine(34) oxidoreductase MnmC [Rhodoferax sp.]|uniref:FAD-dependent 5-carboxymethylaminomethyl-2-thiouridine(34) oxidoreductase MnmC n=1 Tax=Rhodoferax sp. TaxID=50421 RepID=UPI00260B2412|nr:FAD-dependent 5-carboxymethylaminomethyl-2-thiouridine(34) oxidoreductase MnmC [Rhodoferax sp.]MDD2924978.1 FAD-dependent 5-carboxymethylaminomethyl-2-thiouridine(34) oxidoreductase MnmC [Rhodoferax sp.]
MPDWQNLPSWCVLDTHFHHGQHFLNTWRHWLDDADRPRVLHFVALCPAAPTARQLLDAGQINALLLPLAQTLANQWFGLLPGFHRFLLSEGRIILTLCVGDATQSLRQQSFQADAVRLTWPQPQHAAAFDANVLWSVKALARCCRRGTTLHGQWPAGADTGGWYGHFKQCGFVLASEPPDTLQPAPFELKAHFAPSWTLKQTRRISTAALPVQRCAVIGAGLAGASVAASLSRRGWQVQVLDQAATPAAGASGLPVGLVVPHVSSDDCVLSRLSRAGVRLMLQQAQQLLQEGHDWSASGVLERQVGGTPQLPASWPTEGADWTVAGADAPQYSGRSDLGPGLWHPKGGWLKPAALVQAWLSLPGVVFQGHARVCELRKDAGIWHLLDGAGQRLCSAERVVLANACGVRDLLAKLSAQNKELADHIHALPTMQGMRGLLSWAQHNNAQEVFPPFPVNGFSSLVPPIPTEQGLAWFMGSTYQPEQQTERCDLDNHVRNLEHLQQLLPTLAKTLETAFTSGTINAWKNIRCVTTDRLPLVGPLDDGDNPSLWVCTGLGSRGLSFSVLCAELLAAHWGAEPLPVATNLAKALDARRI